MKNKIIKSFWALIIGSVFGLTSCSDMLDINPKDSIDTGNHQLNMPNDTLYSVVGILKQLQQLGERYVVLGDLRGDLMDVTKNADMNLQEIANFTPTTGNPYVSAREYYAVINNCNYYLQRVDTGVVSGGKKVFKGEYAAVKAIRDWTYLQLALNYGKAAYITEPVLNIEDMNRDYPVMEWPQLIQTLLAADLPDLLDETVYPSYGGGLSRNAFISGPSVAGDMLLWLGAYSGDTKYYEQAAMIYYRYIVDNYLMGGGNYYNAYSDNNFQNFIVNWSGVSMNEAFSLILYSTSSSETLTLPSFIKSFFPVVSGNDVFKYMLQPSQAAMNLWKNETFVYYNSLTRDLLYTKGDLRGLCPTTSSYYSKPYGSYYYADREKTMPCIAKYGYYLIDNNNGSINPYVSLYRAGTLYLRYAEALNAMGKPSVAFAVLKHGLKSAVLNDTTIINQEEITPLPPYCDFTDYRFSYGGYAWQTGIHSRGAGEVTRDTLYYSFKKETLDDNREYYGFPDQLATKQDSMLFVDAMICKELGLETAFEGNRFHDLMRFAIRRNDNNFLAKWVGRRNPALSGVLMNRDKWFLPTPE